MCVLTFSATSNNNPFGMVCPLGPIRIEDVARSGPSVCLLGGDQVPLLAQLCRIHHAGEPD
jgi:hypothetical protein